MPAGTSPTRTMGSGVVNGRQTILFTMVTTLLHLMVILSQLLHCLGFSYDQRSSYGPRRWGSFDEMITSCRTGSQQSPAMITTNTAKRIQITDLSYERPHRIMGVFRNNGHAPQFVPDPGSNNELILKNVPELVTNDFVFCDLHFHIGASSNNGPEHILSNHANVYGEVHLVHWKRDGFTPTLSAALRDPNGLAVVAIFFSVIEDCQGETDRIIQQYVSRIKDVDETKQGYINPARFYPNRRYYTYRGSVTTPPCSEIVRWILFETPITICRKSFTILQNMETDEEGSVALSVFGNVRPVQRKGVTDLKKNF